MNSLSLITMCILFALSTQYIYAQELTPTPTIQYSNEFTVENEPSAIISLLKNFIQGFDSFLGGFIFYTPDPLATEIKLQDNSTISGLTKYRDLFQNIATPLVAIIIAIIGIKKIGSENVFELKSFITRLIIVIALFISLPKLLSLSIEINNLLVKDISTTSNLTGFLNAYFDASQEAISQNKNSEQFGIPSFDIANEGGVFRSLGKFIVQIFLFAITFIFLLSGLLYIGYQFVIRFATLLFLGVIYPVVLPFALHENTEKIVLTYIKTWGTFLIQQPAFVLGFAITTEIFNSLLNANGPSVGLLFFYTGFLFFLGGINVLVAQIFGDALSMVSGNIAASVTAGSMTAPLINNLKDYKKAVVSKSISTMLGEKTRSYFIKSEPVLSHFRVTPPTRGTRYNEDKTPKYTKHSLTQRPNNLNQDKNPDLPYYSQNLDQKGLSVTSLNKRLGTVAISGTAYKHEDSKNGLVSYYANPSDASFDGIIQSNLKPVQLNKNTFIDLSQFNKQNPNPHNITAMEESRNRGRKANYAYLTPQSPPQKVSNFLNITKERNQNLNINGVIIKRQATNGEYPVIRLYSLKTYEKHPNL